MILLDVNFQHIHSYKTIFVQDTADRRKPLAECVFYDSYNFIEYYQSNVYYYRHIQLQSKL